ncbi:hypothetical protein [Daejeonella lutea]|uniref:Outer membrane protein beta-barrel family protein n=1 Tax=Daejeonella lutea TaxID=572036 RepID=A0A1T5A026_9SPHI|nr:hypothetical protein [Daejeonella lutea]SKB28205.1 hypothetical protein SAMN05661099_0143 [Daejeonella lutea]
MPNVPNTPMLTSRGELNAAGHVTLKGNISVNSAYAASDHFALMLNGSIMNNHKPKKDFQHNLIETGAGYFTTFGPEKNRILEVYAGVGKGNSERVYKDKTSSGMITEDRQEINFNKTFFQVNYSSKRKQDLKLFGARFPLNYGTALRVSHLKMTEFMRNSVGQAKENNIFLEPVFFTRMAISNAVQIQYTSGSNFGLRNRKFLTAGNSVFSLGLVIGVGGRNLANDDQ